MKIDLQIEKEMLTNPDFLAVLHRACWQLSQPRMIKTFCLHEVGHLVYFEPILKIIAPNMVGPNAPKLIFVGPTISYSELIQQFEFTPAAVKTPFADYGLPYTAEVLEHLARGAVAGAIFLQEFENITNGGDSEDKSIFSIHFELARGHGWVPKRSKKQMWTDAQSEVGLHTKEETFKQLVLDRAARLEVEHFSIRGEA
jgi:hypothetical protein